MDDQSAQNINEELDDVLERLFNALEDIRTVQRRRKIGEETKGDIDEYLVELYESSDGVPIFQDWQVDDEHQVRMALKQLDAARGQLDDIVGSRNDANNPGSLEELFAEESDPE